MAWENWSKYNDEPQLPEVGGDDENQNYYHGFLAPERKSIANGIKRAGSSALGTLAGGLHGTRASLWDYITGVDSSDAGDSASEAVTNFVQNSDILKPVDYWGERVGTGRQVLDDVLENGANVAANVAGMAAISAIPGVGESAIAGKSLMALNAFSQVYGDTYNNLVAQGVDPDIASENAAYDALLQAPMEFIGYHGLLGKLGQLGKPGQAAQQALMKLSKNNKYVAKILGGAATEAPTEFLQEYPDEYFTNRALGKDTDWGEATKNAAYSAAIGGILGGIGGGLSAKFGGNTDNSESLEGQNDTPSMDNEPTAIDTGNTYDGTGTNRPTYTRESAPNPAMYVMSRLVGSGIDEQTAAGIVGGLMQESGGNTVDLSTTAENSSGAYGIAQWLDRRGALEAFAKERGTDPSDLDTQIDFLIHELQGSEGEALSKIKGAKSVEEAGVLADQYYERSEGTDEIRSQKSKNARAIYDAYVNGGSPVSGNIPNMNNANNEKPPKSAEEFLRDQSEAEVATNASGTTDMSKINEINDVLKNGSKQDAENLARKLGWMGYDNKVVSDTPQTTGLPTSQSNGQNAQETPNNASTTVQKQASVVQKQVPVQEQKPVEVKTPNVQKLKEKKATPIETPKTVTPTIETNRPVPVSNPTAPVQANTPIESKPSPTAPIASANAPVPTNQPVQVNGAKPVSQAKINKAVKDKNLRKLVKQAFVDNDPSAMQRLNSLKINPTIIDAVRGAVDPNYTPRANVVNPVQAVSPTTTVKPNANVNNGTVPNVETTANPTIITGNNELNVEGTKEKNNESTNNKPQVRELLHRPEENKGDNTKSEQTGKQEGTTSEAGKEKQSTVKVGDKVTVKGEKGTHTVKTVINKNGTDKPALVIVDGIDHYVKPEDITVTGKGDTNETHTNENVTKESDKELSPFEEGQLIEKHMKRDAADVNTAFKEMLGLGIASKDAKKAKTICGKINNIIRTHYIGNSTAKETIDRINSLLSGKLFNKLPQSVREYLKKYADKKIHDMALYDKENPNAEKGAQDKYDYDLSDGKDSIDKVKADYDSGKINREEAIKRCDDIIEGYLDLSSGSALSHVHDKLKEYVDSVFNSVDNHAPADENTNGMNAKSAKSESAKGNYPTLAKGYTTESGRPLVESDTREFIVRPNGSKEFGRLGKEIEDATGKKVLAKEIRLQVGFSRIANGEETGFGIIHIKKRESQLKKLGYNSAEEYILDIINNFSIIYELGGGRIKLASVGNKFNVMPLDLELEGDGDGYYTVVTAIPKNIKRMQKEVGKKIFDRSASPSSTTGNGAIQNGGNSKNAGSIPQSAVEKSNLPTSTNNIDESTENVNGKDDSVFGSVEDADKELEEVFGLKPKADGEIHRTHKLVDDSDEAIQGYIDEFIRKTTKLHSGFDPTILVPVFKICAAYTQRGVAKFADFANKTISAFKAKGVKQEDIEPWLSPAWESIKNFPDVEGKLDTKKLVTALKAVGARYEKGAKSVDAIKEDIRSKYGDKAVETLNDYIDASFRGVQEYFNKDKINGIIKKDNSTVVPKEENNVPGRSTRPSGTVGMGRSGSGKEEGTGKQRDTGRDSTQTDRNGEQQHGRNAKNNEQADIGTSGKREVEPEKAERRIGVERADSEGTTAGGTKVPVISPKVDKIESDIAKGKVDSVTDVPGNDFAKPTETSEKSTPTTRAKNNINAIKLLKKIESENRMATPREQEILAQYSGFGGLGTEFNNNSKRSKELKEILTEDEYNAVQQELVTAFYTPPFVIKKMWELASRLGFKGGRVLDPSCGIGNFFSLMPKEMKGKSTALQGVELSSIPARIASQLYQSDKFNIANKDYRDFNTGNGFYDLAITNVPFSSKIKPYDKNIKGRYYLHDYYFAKTMQKVRPGGLVMFMTSNSTMENGFDTTKEMLKSLSGQAEFVGAIRMPSNLFEPSAKVTTDIIVLRKLNDGEKLSKDAQKVWDEVLSNSEITSLGNGLTANNYFINNADKVIGDFTSGKNRFGNQTTEVTTTGEKDTAARLENAVKSFPENIYEPRKQAPTNSKEHVNEIVEAEDGNTVGDIVKTKDGKWAQVDIDDNGKMVQKEFKASDQKKIDSFKEIDDALKDVLAIQVDPTKTEKDLTVARSRLNKAYDGFKKKYGCLNDGSNIRTFYGSPSAGRVLALEKYTAPKKGTKGTAEKAPIFTQRTAYPADTKVNISTVSDALVASLRNYGNVNMPFMAEALGKSEEAIAKELGDKVFKDPVTEQFVTRDEYLSGNVRQKLDFAKDAAIKDKSYQRNVKELEAIIPKDIPISQIDISLGSPILTVEDTQRFVDKLLGVEGAVEISFNPALSSWKVKKGTWLWRVPHQTLYNKYGIESITSSDNGIPATEIIEAMLNGNSLSNRSIFSPQEGDSPKTAEERNKAAAKVPLVFKTINEELSKWVSSSKERSDRVEKAYNYKFNATVLRKFDGSLLTFPWLNTAVDMNPKPHQANAVWRTINNRSVLYAHCVGSGKTLTMQAAGMELKRLGLAHKIVYTVPKNVVKQFEREFYQICPNAKILVLDSTTLPPNIRSVHFEWKPKKVKNDKGREVIEKDAEGHTVYEKVRLPEKEVEKRKLILAKRNAMLAKIMTHDWDAIIMSHNTFERLPISDEYKAEFIRKQILQYKEALEAERKENDGRRTKTAKEIQEKITAYEDKITELVEHKEDSNFKGASFEELGIDQLFVDEADVFKNLQMQTKLGQIKGISTAYSGRSEDMLLKTNYLLNSANTHGVVFATGTPISNSITELYTMCRYLENNRLQELGIDQFDQFAKTFIDIGQGEVPRQDGSGYEYKNMVLGLKNAPECVQLFREVADIQTVDDLPYVKAKRPKEHRITSVIKESDWNKAFKKIIRQRSDAIKKGGRKEPPMIESRSKQSKENYKKTGEYLQVKDSPLLLANDFKNATLSPYLYDNTVTGEEGFAKVWKCADNVFAEYKKTSDVSGAQLVFCDLSTPSANGDVSIYSVLKDRLIELGIPEKEIAFVHDAKTDKAQAELFQNVNEGKVRVLIGSTSKMGAGTNMQKKLVALHHLDCPWRPRDIEQREGRILRQGNDNKEVDIYNYVAEGTYDANLWDLMRSKAATINKIMHGDVNLRNASTEGVDENNFTQLSQLANADPAQKRYIEIGKELRELNAAKSAFESASKQAKVVLESYPAKIKETEEAVANIKQDVERAKKQDFSKFSITIDGKEYTNRNEANDAFAKKKEEYAREWARALYKFGNDSKLKDVKIGSVAGFDIYASADNRYFRAGKNSSDLTIYIKGKDRYGTNTPTALGAWNAIQTQPSAKLMGNENALASFKNELEEAKKNKGGKFPDSDRLEALQKEHDELKAQIDEKARQQALEDSSTVNIELYDNGMGRGAPKDFDMDDPDFYDIADNIERGFIQSANQTDGSIGSVSFDKPKGWEDFKKRIIDKTNWTASEFNGKVTLISSKENFRDMLDAIENQEDSSDGKYRLSVGGDAIERRTPEEMKKSTLSIFPNATNVEGTESGMSFDLPDGTHMKFNFTDDTIGVNREKAQKDYGGSLKGDEKALGKIEVFDREAIVTLTLDNVEDAVTHEAGHFAWLKMTPREKVAVSKVYKNEEAMCEGIRKWKIARKNHQGTLLGKIFQRISDFAHKVLAIFHENEHNVFRKVVEGQMWKRKSDNKAAAHVAYLMNPANKVKEFLEGKDYNNDHITFKERPKDKGWSVGESIKAHAGSTSRIKAPVIKRLFELGDKAQKEMQESFNRWSHQHTMALKNLKTDMQKQAFDKLVMEEDAEQHVFTKEEMQDALREAGVPEAEIDGVIRAHDIDRSLLGKIYKAVNNTYTKAVVTTKVYNTREDAEARVKEAIKSPYEEVIGDVKQINQGGKVKYQVSVKAPHFTPHPSVEMTAKELKELKKDKYNVVTSDIKLSNGHHSVSWKSYAKPLTNMDGYMPHFFHGFMIIRIGEDGNAKVVGSATTRSKAVAKAEEMHSKDGGKFLISSKQFQFNGELENPITMGDMDYRKLMKNLQDGTTMSLDEARKLSQARMKNRHVFFGQLKKRKGAKGYESNARWAIQQHISSAARYCALDEFKTKSTNLFERAYGNKDSKYSGFSEANFAQGYIDAVLGVPNGLQKTIDSILRYIPGLKDMNRPGKFVAGTITHLMGVLKLGASFASGFVNLVQITNAVLYLGGRRTIVGIKRAFNPTFADKRILRELGVDEETGLGHDSDYGKVRLEENNLTRTADRYTKIADKLMLPFSKAETILRRATVLAAYYKHLEEHANDNASQTYKKNKAKEYALEINRKVNFDYSVADAPYLFRETSGTVIGDALLQFQKYGVKEMEVIANALPFIGDKNIPTKQKMEFFGMMLMIGGVFNAVPFQDLILSILGGLFGYDDPEKEAKKAMIEWAGNDPMSKALVNVANYGAGSLVGMDISQRVGLKGVVPEVSGGGPLASTTIGLAKAIINGDTNGAMKSISPALGNIYGAVAGYNTDSKGRKTVEYGDWGTADGAWNRAMRFLGFRTVKEATATDAQNIIYNYKDQKKNAREKAKSEYFKNPSSDNIKKLKDLGYTDKQIKDFKDNKNSTRVERAQSGLSKDDMKKLKPVFDYAN